MVDRKPLIAGNWKMNFNHLEAISFVQKLAWTLRDAKHDGSTVEVAVFPPYTDIRSVQTIVQADSLDLEYGAQDLSAHDSGAFTGEISGAFIKTLDAKYVLIGHSERRQYHAETDEVVAEKITAALRNKLVPVVCVGETLEDLEQHGPSAVAASQLKVALGALKADDEFVIAYEPVWAIGTGKAASESDAQNVAKVLRDTINDALGAEVAEKTRVLYGGSVKANNIASYMRQSDIDGALVGGASLVLDEFASIIQYQKHIGV